METNQGLWATNPDGSGLTQLTEIDYWNGNLQDAVQPGGNQVVFISPGDNDFHHMALNLLSLPDGKITKITDLTSPETETYADSGPGNAGFEALRAVREQRSYAWGAGGALLAFVGVMEGSTADMYIYNVNTGRIQHVSQDDAHAYWPSWSSYSVNGYHLLFLEAERFGTGNGSVMAGVWSANVSSTEGQADSPTLLYVPDSAGEEIVGWLDGNRVILDSRSPTCNNMRLRIYDLASQQETVIDEGCIIDAAADAGGPRVVFANETGLYTCYYASGHSLCPYPLDQRRVTDIELMRKTFTGSRDATYAMTFESGGMAIFGPEYQASPVNAPSMDVAVASDSAWTSEDVTQPGVWVSSPNIGTQQIFSESARLPIWGPVQNLLFLAPDETDGYNLYLARFSASYVDDLSVVNYIPAEVYTMVWSEGQ
jgi:hypothetical protein